MGAERGSEPGGGARREAEGRGRGRGSGSGETTRAARGKGRGWEGQAGGRLGGGGRRALTVDSRTWLWKCCSRADTSSCPSILLHARHHAARVRALHRTIACRPEGLDGRPAGRDGSSLPLHRPRPRHRALPQPPPQKKPLGLLRAGAARAGAGRGRVLTSEEGAARQRSAPRLLRNLRLRGGACRAGLGGPRPRGAEASGRGRNSAGSTVRS